MKLFFKNKWPFLASYIIANLLFYCSCEAQIALPYTEAFTGITAANGFPTVTGGAWTRTGSTAIQPTYITNQATYNRVGRGDSKFMSFRYNTGTNTFAVGPFALSAGEIYQVGNWYITDGLGGWTTFKLTYGTGVTVALQSNTIVSVSAATNTFYQHLQGAFSPATSGNYYIAMTMTSTSAPNYFSVDDFSIYEIPPPCIGAPNAPIIYGQNSICEGNSAILSVTGISQSLNLITNWLIGYSPGGPYSTMSSNPNNSNEYTTPNLSAGTYYYICQSVCENSGETSSSNEITITVSPSPIITTQPLSFQNSCLNQNTTELSILYEGGTPNVSYQWYYTTNGLNTGGTLVSGATNSTYIPPNNLAFNRYYYCVLSFAEGCAVNSNAANVVITTSPTISTQPTSNQTKCVDGTTVNLTVATINGVGTPLFQWYSNSQNSYSGIPINGANNSIFTPSSNSIGTIYYYCQVTFPFGNCGSLYSNISTVNIISDPSISIQPIAEQTICSGGTASTLSIQAATGIGTFSYQWYYNNINSTVGGSVLSGANTISYSPGTYTAIGNRYYYVVITNSVSGCNSLTSEVSQLNIVSDPIPSITPASQVICTNGIYSDLNAEYTGGYGTPSYQWYNSANGSNVGGTAITGANTSTFLPPNQGSSNSYYYCLITLSGSGCSAKTGVSVTSTNSSFQYLTQPFVSQTICSDGNTTPLVVSVLNNSANSTYQWYSNTTNSYANSIPISGANSSTYSPPSSSDGLRYYFCTANVNSISCQSNISSVLVVADPVISQQPISEQTICVGGIPNPVSVSVSGGIGTTTYQWFTSGSFDLPIPGANSATYAPGMFNTPSTTYYYASITFSGSGCNSLTTALSQVNVVNDPTIATVDPNDPYIVTVCMPNNPACSLSAFASGGSDLNYQWFENNINSQFNGTAIANANSSDFSPSTNSIGDIFYYCEVTSAVSGCTSPLNTGVFQLTTIEQPHIFSEAYPIGSCVNNIIPPIQISGNYDDIAVIKFFKSNIPQIYFGPEVNSSEFAPESNIPGNYTYYFTYDIDYLNYYGCITDTSEFYNVTITEIPNIDLINSDHLIGCEGAEFNLTNLVQSNLQESYSIIWSVDNTVVDTINNSTNYQTLPIAEGSHQIQAEVISSFDNCIVSDSVILNLNVAPTPYIVEELNFDQNICPYDTEINIPTIELSNDYSLITPNFEWFGIYNNTNTPISFANTNSYLPPIQNNSNYQSFCRIYFGLPGCTTLQTSISEISIDYMNGECFPFFNIPEAISPNNDGINDYWTINEISLFNGYTINIFNSFGQSIYQIKNTPPNWDGTWNGQTLPNGDYFYSVKLDELNRTIFGAISIAK